MTSAASGSLLRGVRLERRLSPADVAGQVGVHPQTVLRWERFERMPGSREVDRLARALAVPREVLLGELDRHRPAPARTPGHPGAGLRTLRRRAGLGVRELAAHLGVPSSTVHNWERGQVRVPHDQAEAAATLLGLDVDALVRTLRSSPGPDVVVRPVPRSELARLRGSAGLTVSEVARRTDLRRHRVAELEAGKPFVRGREVRALAAVLGCAPQQLLRVHPVEDPLLLRPHRWGPGHLPRLVRAHRRWGGDTQASLGLALGCSGETVRAWERGAATPRPGRRRRMEQRWRLRPGDLDRAVTEPC